MSMALVTPFLMTLAPVTLGPYDPGDPYDPCALVTPFLMTLALVTLVLMTLGILALMTLATPSLWPWLL